MNNLVEGLSTLGALALGGFFFIVLADVLGIPYETMGLYCLCFALFTLVILIPYYLLKRRKQNEHNDGDTRQNS